MQSNFNEKTTKEKIVHVIRWILQIAALLIFAYVLFLRFRTGQHIPMPLIGCILLVVIGIFRIISARDRHRGSEEDKQKFNKIVVRSVILGLIIVIAFITIVVLMKLNMG